MAMSSTMATGSERKSRHRTRYIAGALISLSVITAYALYRRHRTAASSSNSTPSTDTQQCACKDSNDIKHTAKAPPRKKKKQCIKLSSNYKCLTLELSNKLNEYECKLNRMELSHVKTRKDKTSFLVYCSNCLQAGHDATKCDRRHKICVAGDSHTSVWGVASRFYANTDIVRVRIPGMSAQGLVNQHSTLKSSHKIVRAFRNCHSGNSAYLFVQIGQVDIDYMWYFRRMKYGETLTFEQQIETSIDHLFAFLNDTLLNQSNMENVKIVIHGVHLPPLGNEEMKGKLYNHFMDRCKLSKEYLDKHLVLPSHAQRTQMALQFNRRLTEKCKQCGYDCVDISEEILDTKTGIVDDKYVKHDEVDIHLNPHALVPIYHQRFKEMKLAFAIEMDAINEKVSAFKNQLIQRFQVQ